MDEVLVEAHKLGDAAPPLVRELAALALVRTGRVAFLEREVARLKAAIEAHQAAFGEMGRSNPPVDQVLWAALPAPALEEG